MNETSNRHAPNDKYLYLNFKHTPAILFLDAKGCLHVFSIFFVKFILKLFTAPGPTVDLLVQVRHTTKSKFIWVPVIIDASNCQRYSMYV